MVEVVGYVRVSRVAGREGDSFLSPELQPSPLRGWLRGKTSRLSSGLRNWTQAVVTPPERVGIGPSAWWRVAR